jgi:hypothetical protein
MFQTALRLLDVGVAEHQLDRADVHSIAQEPTGALVTEVVPVQVDLPELLAIDASTGFRTFGIVTVREEQQRFPCRLEAADELPADEPNTNAFGPSVWCNTGRGIPRRSDQRRLAASWAAPVGLARRDLAQERRLPDAFGHLLRLDRVGGSARQGEVIDRHAPALALVHHVEPAGMLAAGLARQPFRVQIFRTAVRFLPRLQQSRWCTALDPVKHVDGMKPSNRLAAGPSLRESHRPIESPGKTVERDLECSALPAIGRG